MRYVSKKKELCIVMIPQDRIIDEQRRVKLVPGKRIEFFNGIYETHDPDIIDFLSKHPYRNRKFMIVEEKDEKAVEEAKKAIPLVNGMLTTSAVPKSEIDEIIEADLGKVEVPTRPTDTVAVSPELIRVIDERINSALSVIVDLLRKDEVKEEKVVASKPTKTFSCPFCGEPQPSGFAVGKHKKECSKNPNKS